MRQQLLRLQDTLPPKVKTMLLRAIGLFIGWTLLYQLLLKPTGIPDTQLTNLVVVGTVKMLSLFFTNVTNVGPHVFINGVQSVNIAPQCNGLELIVLYIGFLLCYPSSFKKGLLYGVVGTLVITFLNMVRCSLLAWMYVSQMSMADFAHHFGFKLIIYGVVFLGWVLYTKSPKPSAA